eukprot:g472.t1
MATGGDDMKLNVWVIGSLVPQKSLLVNKSPVEAVCFDPSDEYVATGSTNSVVTLWDLPNEKAGRTFDGHHTAVKTVQFHPNKGYYIVSGAVDSSVKIWDVRRKSCVHTFNGKSSKAATRATYSPDGKWIAAGFANGEVELWDIRRRTQVMSFSQHRRRVSGIEFHPNECIMATCSQDGHVRLWDLENSEMIDKINTGEQLPHSVCFSLTGDCIYTALSEGLLCHSWEPTHLHGTVTASLHHAADMMISEDVNKMVICTHRQNSVGAWIVDLNQFGPHKGNSKSRRSSSESIPSLKIETNVQSGGGGGGGSGDRRDSKDSDRPNSGHLSNTSARFSDKYGNSQYYSDRSGQMKLYNSNSNTTTTTTNNNKTDSDSIKSVRLPTSNSVSSTGKTPTSVKSSRSPHTFNLLTLPHNQHDSNSNPLPPKASTHDRSGVVPRGMISSRTHGEGQHQKVLLDRYDIKTERYGIKKEASFTTKDINVDSFLPKTRHDINLPDFDPNDEDCIQDMASKKDKIRRALSSRLFSLQVVRKFWEADDMKETLKVLKKSDNPSVSVDFFEAGVPLQKLLTLELIPSLVPLFVDMMETDHEKYRSVALKLLLKLLKGFGGTIRETINGSNMSIGVNLAFEQRHEKCKMAQECLLEIQPIVDKIKRAHGEVGILARDIHGRLTDLTT